MLRFAVCLIVASAAVAAPVPKEVKKAPSFDGRWITTVRNHSGAEIKDPWVWVIDGEKLTIHQAKNGGVGEMNYSCATLTFSHPEGAKADEYDYTYQDSGRTIVYRGRVQWDGDEFLFCFGQAGGDRPADVKAGKDLYFHRFKRIANK